MTTNTHLKRDGDRHLRPGAYLGLAGLAGVIKPSIRAIYAAEGASQGVARRYLVELVRLGIIEPAGHGKRYRLSAA